MLIWPMMLMLNLAYNNHKSFLLIQKPPAPQTQPPNDHTEPVPDFYLQRQSVSTKAINKTRFSLLGRDAKCIYSARVVVTSDEDDATAASRLGVGVYDTVTRQLLIYPSTVTKSVFTLKQSVSEYLQQHPSNNSTALVGATVSRSALYDDFGSAKKRQVLKSQAANRVTVETVVGAGPAMVNAILQGHGMSASNQQALQKQQQQRELVAAAAAETTTGSSSLPDETMDAWRRSFLPPFNETAREPQDVYRPQDIAGEAAWTQVSRVVDAVYYKKLNGQEKHFETAEEMMDALLFNKKATQDDGVKVENKNPSFTVRWEPCLYELVKKLVQSHLPKKDQVKCALLTNYYMHLYNTLSKRQSFTLPPRRPDQPSRFHGTPLPIAERFVEQFATELVRDDGTVALVMSKPNRERCCLHTLLLFLLANNPVAMRCNHIQPVVEVLALDMKHATQLLKLAGFTIKRIPGSPENAMAVFLNTPLVFPAPLRKSSGGKRS